MRTMLACALMCAALVPVWWSRPAERGSADRDADRTVAQADGWIDSVLKTLAGLNGSKLDPSREFEMLPYVVLIETASDSGTRPRPPAV